MKAMKYSKTTNLSGSVNEIIFGELYSDGSMREAFRLYTDENNIMQLEFYAAFGYTFFANCELVEIMKDDLTGVTLGMIAEELEKRGMKHAEL